MEILLSIIRRMTLNGYSKCVKFCLALIALGLCSCDFESDRTDQTFQEYHLSVYCSESMTILVDTVQYTDTVVVVDGKILEHLIIIEASKPFRILSKFAGVTNETVAYFNSGTYRWKYLWGGQQNGEVYASWIE